jgi:poly(3-hydroxybutyrate) depolymerase
MIVTGPASIMGAGILLTVGAKSMSQKGPIVIYWHGTGGSAATAGAELGPTVVSEVMASGGVIASMESGGKGNPIDWGVFTTGDFEIVDLIVACAVQQLNIDTRRIYTSGASAGGLAAGTLMLARSSYMAAGYPNSGGVAPWPGLATLQDKTHVPAAFTMHGAMDVDKVVIDFGTASMDMDKVIAAAGGFAVDCNHGGGHVAAPADLKAAGWEFVKAHPFGTKPSPYAGGLPANFPKYCMIVK